jgi:DNA-binding beta-propeller fold protein YncE
LKLVVIAILLLAGTTASLVQDEGPKLAWPSPPDRARIVHLRTIASVQATKGNTGFFSKLLGFVFGDNSTSRWLVQPVGLALSPHGQLYVTDPGAKGIHIIDSDRGEYEFLGQTKFGAFRSPVGIAFAPDGTMFVSDSELGEVLAFDEDNDATFQVRDHLVRPTGLAVLQNRLYVADASRHSVVVFDVKGNYLFEFGRRGADSGSFNYPVHVAGRTSLYVIDALNYRVEQFTLDGKFVSTIGKQGSAAGSFASPKAAAVDSDGNIYVTDALMDNIQIFNPEGQLLLVVGQQGDRDGQFMSPGGLVIDSKDNIFVVDMLNKRIQVFQYLK